MRIAISFINAVWLAGKPEAMPCFYESFVEGLRDHGHDLLVFSSPCAKISARMDERLKRQIVEFSPDLVIAFNNFGPDYASFCECPILVYEVDSILYYHRIEWVQRNPNRYLYCTTQHESRTILAERFAVEDGRIAELPFLRPSAPKSAINSSMSRLSDRDSTGVDSIGMTSCRHPPAVRK